MAVTVCVQYALLRLCQFVHSEVFTQRSAMAGSATAAMHSFFWEIPVFNWCCCELALYIFHLAPFLKFGPFGPNGPFGPLGCPSHDMRCGAGANYCGAVAVPMFAVRCGEKNCCGAVKTQFFITAHISTKHEVLNLDSQIRRHRNDEVSKLHLK